MGKGKARRKGMRRSHLAHFSSSLVKVGREPNHSIMAEHQHRARSLAVAFITLENVFSQERMAALSKAKKIIEADDMTLSYAWLNTPERKVYLFFNSRKDRFMVLRTDHLRHVQQRSIVYTDEGRIKEKFKLNKICWAETISIEFPTDVRPPAS